MRDPTDPVAVPETTPLEAEAAPDAPASRVGSGTGDTPEPLPGTDTMDAETGGLAGTSR